VIETFQRHERGHGLKLFYHGPSEDDSEFCDQHWVDLDVMCDDKRLWAIEEDGYTIGFVCDPHKDAYKREVGLE
jgi:hypothetical protein